MDQTIYKGKVGVGVTMRPTNGDIIESKGKNGERGLEGFRRIGFGDWWEGRGAQKSSIAEKSI